jgi:hypothetical protein
MLETVKVRHESDAATLPESRVVPFGHLFAEKLLNSPVAGTTTGTQTGTTEAMDSDTDHDT